MDPSRFRKRYFTLARADIGHLRFILESYDGLAFARTLDSRAGLVEIAYPESRARDADALIKALVGEIGLKETAAPEHVPPL